MLPIPTVGEYSIKSPWLKPWLLKVMVSKDVEIPAGFTLNLRCWYPDPELSTFTSNKVFFEAVLNLWIPPAAESVANPTVLIPDIPNRASFFVLKILTVFALTTLTKYGSPSDRVSVIVLFPRVLIPIDAFPLFL